MANNPSTTCIFQSKEYWLILGLIANDIPAMDVICKQNEQGQDYLLWSFPLSDAVSGMEKDYNLGKPIMLDLQKMRSAAEVFKRNMQYFRIR